MVPLDYLADTSAVIRLLRGDASVEEFFAGKKVGVSFVTLAELYVGALKANRRGVALFRLNECLANRTILLVTFTTTLNYAKIYVDLERRGVMIPVNDIWVAAVAMERELPLVARDEHFSRVQGIKVISC